MRAVIQRVTTASVTVNDSVISLIGNGLCVLVGIHDNDTAEDMEWISSKILDLRLFEKEGKAWAGSAKELNLEVLCVSQFTLYAQINKGKKPDFHAAMKQDRSRDFYKAFLDMMKNKYDSTKIKDGEFGTYMKVDIQNDGPVTIILDSRDK
jgi:D-tyrosyl-tRNA(Tyr) deacylase